MVVAGPFPPATALLLRRPVTLRCLVPFRRFKIHLPSGPLQQFCRLVVRQRGIDRQFLPPQIMLLPMMGDAGLILCVGLVVRHAYENWSTFLCAFERWWRFWSLWSMTMRRSRCLECTTMTMTMTATSARIDIFRSARRRIPVDGPPMNDFHYARRINCHSKSTQWRAAPDLPQHTLLEPCRLNCGRNGVCILRHVDGVYCFSAESEGGRYQLS